MRISDWSSDVCSSDLVADDSNDDLAPQPVASNLRRVGLAQQLGEIGRQVGGEIGIVRQVGLQKLIVEHQLGVREQHRDLRAAQPLAAAQAVEHLLVVGQVLDATAQLAGLLECAYEAREAIEQMPPQHVDQRDGMALQVVVAGGM